MAGARGGRGGFFEARLGFEEFGGWVRRDGAGVVVVGGAEDEVGGECEVVHPVRVCREGLREGAVIGIPDFDRFVVRGAVDFAGAAPSHAGHGSLVSAQDELDSLGYGVPDAYRGVFGG